MATMELMVNGQTQSVEADPETALLYVLRNQLQLNGPKFGCGIAQCGACTVLIDGTPTRSCQTPMLGIGDKDVVTLEGLGTPEEPGVLQQAFIDEQAAQCGHCINGMVMMATALLEQNPDPSEEDIRNALAANLCRCGTHLRIARAIKRAAEQGVTA